MSATSIFHFLYGSHFFSFSYSVFQSSNPGQLIPPALPPKPQMVNLPVPSTSLSHDFHIPPNLPPKPPVLSSMLNALRDTSIPDQEISAVWEGKIVDV